MQAKPPDWPDSRMAQAKAAGVTPEMPPLPAETEPLFNAFLELGMVLPLGMGMAPLPYTEIAAGVPWADEQERAALRAMSRAYLEGQTVGQDPFGVPPWGG